MTDYSDSKFQYDADKGKQIQQYLAKKIAKPEKPLRQTGQDIAGDDIHFELCVLIDSTGSMGPWIKRAF